MREIVKKGSKIQANKLKVKIFLAQGEPFKEQFPKASWAISFSALRGKWIFAIFVYNPGQIFESRTS